MEIEPASLIVAAVIQGFGELIPISSSAHLFFAESYFGINTQGRVFEICLHFGSLLGLMYHFRLALVRMVKSGVNTIVLRRAADSDFHRGLHLIVATLPAIISGYIVSRSLALSVSSPLIGGSFLIFGLCALLAEKYAPTTQSAVTYKHAILIGLGQMLAFIPGASRLGLCATVARLMGIERRCTLEFSLMLAIPVLLGAVTLTIVDLYKSRELHLMLTHCPTILLTGLLTIIAMPYVERIIARYGFAPFARYRIALGCGIVAYYAWQTLK